MDKETKKQTRIKKLRESLHEHQLNAGQWTTFSVEHHTCTSCGHSFEGRYCPQCGMDATETRFSFRGVWNSVMSVFDFTDRSVPRTVRDLFWRPGYLIGDYLDGRRRIYFPPIKLFLVIVFVFAVVVQILNVLGCEVQVESLVSQFDFLLKTGNEGLWDNFSERQMLIANVLEKFLEWCEANAAYGEMLQSMLWIVSLWIAMKLFSKKYTRKYNLPEVFMAEMYVLSQIQVATIVYMCLDAVFGSSNVVTATLPSLLMFGLRFYDYWQLYRRGVWGTLWRMAVAYLILGIALLTFLTAIVLLFVFVK